MSKGAWAASGGDTVAIAADESRGGITLQHFSGDAVFLGFGEAGTIDEGLRLSATAPIISIEDSRAAKGIHMLCAAGESASGGWQGR